MSNYLNGRGRSNLVCSLFNIIKIITLRLMGDSGEVD